MAPEVILLVALFSISGIVSAMLAAAWVDLGRPAHTRIWALAFAVAAVAWAIQLAERVALPGSGWSIALPGLLGLAAALVAIGFRRRAGLRGLPRLLVGLAFGHALVCAGLGLSFRSPVAWVAPLSAFNAAMFWLAARTLDGQRRSERLAIPLTEFGLRLVALLHLALIAGLVAEAAGLLRLDLPRIGTVVLLLLPSVQGSIGLFTIILMTADLADRTRRLAATDMLTGLLNRRGFEAAAAGMFDATRAERRPLAVVMIDIDHFKEINDRFGHPAGDRVLCGVSTRIGDVICRRDIFARVGGEEFALVLRDVDPQAASCAVEVMRREVEAMTADLPVPHRVTASFGVAATETMDEDMAALLGRADQALYRAKTEGRNRVMLAA